MAVGTTQLADVIVPEIFSPYVQQVTQEKSRLIQSGAAVMDPGLSTLLAGGGTTFNEPSFRDLDNDADRVSTDNPATIAAPNKIGTSREIQVRLSRNNSWSSMDLTGDLAGADPMGAIAARVSSYWVRRLQAAFVATVTGIFADNAKAPDGGFGDTHTQGDMTHDISGVFADGVTNFSAEAFIDACLTMGDSLGDLSLVMVHSIVYGRMQKNNLIDMIPDARGEIMIPTFLGRTVVVDDAVPFSGGDFQTWLFGNGAVRVAMGSPKVPTEVDRVAASGNGSGQSVLHNRTEWILHPVGNAFRASAAAGGPTNATTATNLGHEDSWTRVFPERKQIQIARLITTEF